MFFIKQSSLLNATVRFIKVPSDVHDVYIQVVNDNEAIHSLKDVKHLLNAKKIKLIGGILLLVSDSTMQCLLNQQNESLYRHIHMLNQKKDESLYLLNQKNDESLYHYIIDFE